MLSVISMGTDGVGLRGTHGDGAGDAAPDGERAEVAVEFDAVLVGMLDFTVAAGGPARHPHLMARRPRRTPAPRAHPAAGGAGAAGHRTGRVRPAPAWRQVPSPRGACRGRGPRVCAVGEWGARPSRRAPGAFCCTEPEMGLTVVNTAALNSMIASLTLSRSASHSARPSFRLCPPVSL